MLPLPCFHPGCACAGLEMAADPLNRSGVHTKLFGDLAHTQPPWLAQSRADGRFNLGGYRRPGA